MIRTLAHKLRQAALRFHRSEDGNSTIEFVIVLPAFFLLFTSAYEGGVLSTRHVVLEGAVDRAVRDVRIGKMPDPTHDSLTRAICDYARIIPNCLQNIRLEMINNDLRNWTAISEQVACVDRDEEAPPLLNFTNGGNNQLMILRACVLFDPMIPTTGLGKAIPKESGGAYGLVATSSYVMEPFRRPGT